MHTSAATPQKNFYEEKLYYIFPGVPENFVHHMQVHRNQGKFCIFYLMPPHYICVFTFSAELKMLRKIFRHPRKDTINFFFIKKFGGVAALVCIPDF